MQNLLNCTLTIREGNNVLSLVMLRTNSKYLLKEAHLSLRERSARVKRQLILMQLRHGKNKYLKALIYVKENRIGYIKSMTFVKAL